MIFDIGNDIIFNSEFNTNLPEDIQEYQDSREFLFRVIENIEMLNYKEDVECYILIQRNTCLIVYTSEGHRYNFLETRVDKTSAIWNAVVKFIEWYEENVTNL